MMLTQARRILIAIALASHAAAALSGPGHHALGILAERLASVEHADAPCSEAAGAVLHADAECPICDFLSLASLPPSLPPATLRLAEQPSPPDLTRARPARPIALASSPRAPPFLPF